MTQVVVIDPGHGGTANVGGSGWNHATGPDGLMEKKAALDVGRRVAAHFALLGYRVLLTRDTDVNVGINDRARLAVDNDAAVFVSIHFNGDDDPDIQGTECWIGKGSPPACKLLAQGVLDRVVAANGLRNRGVNTTTGTEYGVVNPANQLETTAYALMEMSFITNPAEERRLGTDSYLDLIAGAVAIGIDDYLKMSSGSSEPLHFAIRSGNAAAVRELLKAGANPATRDLHGMTPLMIAARAGNVRMIKMLVTATGKPKGPTRVKKRTKARKPKARHR